MSKPQVVQIDERGDWSAPEGSAPWLRAVCLKIKTLYGRVIDEENELGSWVQALQAHQAWQVLGFGSWEAFCRAQWSEGGLGITPESLHGEVQRRQLAAHGGDRRSARGKADQLDNVNLKGGNQAAYLLARLQRDAPEIAARLERGEFRSARAAAIAAGIIVPLTPLARAQQAYRRLSPSDQATFRRWVANRNAP